MIARIKSEGQMLSESNHLWVHINTYFYQLTSVSDWRFFSVNTVKLCYNGL